MKPRTTVRVGLLGWGAIASQVGRSLLSGAVPGAELVAVSALNSPGDLGIPHVGLAELPLACDLIVEAAGPVALSSLIPHLAGNNTDLLIVSVGALSDAELFKKLFASPASNADGSSGRTFLSSGAIGGLDILAAAARFGTISSVQLTTTKPSRVLERPWMTPDMIRALTTEEVVECFSGTAAQAVEKFPESVNVAATLACCAGDWNLVTVRVVGDPTATRNVHNIVIDAQAGNYRFEIANHPSLENPKTSAVTAFAVLQGISRYAHGNGVIL
jgi:aspartate dehydrogenase